MNYWILKEELGYSFGVDQAPKGAELFETEKEQLSEVEKLDKEVQKQLDDFFSEVKEEKRLSKELDLFKYLCEQGVGTEKIAKEFLKKELKQIAREVGAKVSGSEKVIIENIKKQIL